MRNDAQVEFFRCNQPVTNFFSALGAVRETRLTASLGYLISQYPESLGSLFLSRHERVVKVIIEESDDESRYDVVFETNKGALCLEAKLGLQQCVPVVFPSD